MAESSVSRLIKRALDRLEEDARETADDVRRLMLERLDRMLRGLSRQIAEGEPRAIEVALKVEDRRARLLGLDAPKVTEVTGKGGGPVQVNAPMFFLPQEIPEGD